MAEEEGKKRKRGEAEGGDEVSAKAAKWAKEFAELDEENQYTYLEELAPSMTKMHLQFLQGILGFDDDEDDEEEEEESGEEEDEEEEDDDDDGEDGGE